MVLQIDRNWTMIMAEGLACCGKWGSNQRNIGHRHFVKKIKLI
jgi:hypothetical protein